jgi:hypothetical protein
MGSEISSFVVEPLLGIGIIALAIFAIIEQNKNSTTGAKWSAIGAVILTIILIVVNIMLTAAGG